jgi:hypothetical protein
MKKIIFLIPGIFILVLFSCHKKAITANNAVAETKKAILDPNADMTATGTSYKVDSLAMNANILSVFVNYSGGCKDHSFELFSDGMYAKSIPPQLRLCLKHEANNDECKKPVKQELKFDVTDLKTKGGKTLILIIGEKRVSWQ